MSLISNLLQGCSSPLVVKLADTQRDKEQRRLQQQLVQQIQQLNNASTWGNLAGLGTLSPQYLAVSLAQNQTEMIPEISHLFIFLSLFFCAAQSKQTFENCNVALCVLKCKETIGAGLVCCNSAL